MKLICAMPYFNQSSTRALARFLLNLQDKVEDVPPEFIELIYDLHAAHHKEFRQASLLAVNMDTDTCLENVVNNIFVNEECTWEKIATIYAFAITFAENRIKEEVAEIASQHVGKFHWWIESQGGWPKHKNKCKRDHSITFWISCVGLVSIFGVLLYRAFSK